MAFVNTKIKYPDDEPDCAQAFILARRQEMGGENLKKPLETFLFRISQPKQPTEVTTAEMPAVGPGLGEGSDFC